MDFRQYISSFVRDIDCKNWKRRLESSFDKNSSELLIKSGDLQTLNLSLHYNEKSPELKRKYNSKEDEPSETSPKDEIESESSDQTYNPSSDSEYSIKAKVKGSYYLDYFIVPGEIDWELKDSIMKRIHKGFMNTLMMSSGNVPLSEIRTQYPYIPENVFDLCGNVVKIASREQDPQKHHKADGEFEEIMHQILSNLYVLLMLNIEIEFYFNTYPNTNLTHFRVDCYQNSFIKNNEIEDTHIQNYVSL
ncbi:hypothetical protein F8M41_024427 [Gigaspora margarita]|uniref:Uncharacterized protein n=1 Tax=Gigaspora margarita TaxID=4874 RepID=A0A8H4B0E9_GIGMA|nr:hypothetical protein F8M41_024427 [Gigaspora margarita]